jgi:hypothetical protein
MHAGGGGRGRVNIVPPQLNFKTLVNKNAIKLEIRKKTRQFFLKALTPLGILSKNIRYPPPLDFPPVCIYDFDGR